MATNDRGNIRVFVIEAVTEQFKGGDSTIDKAPIIEAVLADGALTRRAVVFAVEKLCSAQVQKLIRKTLIHQHDDREERGGVSGRLIAAVIDYGLSLLDIRFGAKRLGDYLPTEAVAYASQQHASARTVAIQARFVASVAKACHDDTKPIREQLTNEQVETIRRATIESSPNKDVAEIVLAVA